MAIVVAVIALVVGTSWWVGLAVHLTAFAVVALAFHRELSDRRPGPEGLTQYFLLISVGGAVGGLVNAVVAPLVFTKVAEYPLMLAVAAALAPRRSGAAAATSRRRSSSACRSWSSRC